MNDNIVDEAQKAAERLEAANAQLAELIKKQEAMQARQVLSGKSEAGKPQEQPLSEEEKLKREANAFFKGTLLEGVMK